MPIYEQTYRRYSGLRLPPCRGWWVIARTGLASALLDRRFVGLLLLAWAPFLVRAVQIYASANFQQVGFLAPTVETFRTFIAQQSTFMFFVTVYAGAGLIADDRHANALQLYLSKPVTRSEYVVGKSVILVVLLLAVTWLPAMALLLWQVTLTGDAFLLTNSHLGPAIMVFSVIEALVAALPMLALSSLSSSRRFVSVLYAGVVLFSGGLATALGAETGRGWWSWLSPEHALAAVGDAIFRIQTPSSAPIALAAVALAAIVLVSLVVLRRTVCAVDVVSS